MTRLRVNEIFVSLQGEGLHTGELTTFVRLTGCPLRCHYCDTSYAFDEGQWLSLEEIAEQVASLGARRVLVTGGEPLAQKACLTLLTQLCDQGYQVDLETSGALPIDDVDARVGRILDIKTPGSGEESRNRWENLPLLGARDQVKLVLVDRQDYEWSKQLLNERPLHQAGSIIFSPAGQQLSPTELADWIVQDRLPVRFQIQLHKVLWNDEPGR